MPPDSGDSQAFGSWRGGANDRRSMALLAGLLLAALAHYSWSLTTHQPFIGYDVDGHMQYVATLLDEALSSWPASIDAAANGTCTSR